MKRGIYIVMGLVATFLRGFAQEGASNIEFVENKGQWDSRVKFKGELSTGALYLEKNGFSVMLYDTADLAALNAGHHGSSSSGGVSSAINEKGMYKSAAATIGSVGASG